MKYNLGILGASARAASASAVRAGFAPTAVDLFADLDTQAIARAVRIADYPSDFASAARELPDASWIYTGGLENYPALVDAIAAERLLWGNTGGVLQAVRDPLRWTEVLQRAGCPVPAVTRNFSAVPRDGRWLAKPLRSAGGFGISLIDAQSDFSDAASERYFQRRVEGTSMSAVFVAAERKSQLLGATEQLSGAPWTGAPPFVYAGSIGPQLWEGEAPAEPRNLAQQLQRLGDVLADAFALVGLFGVDGMLNDEGFWPIEINPRYTASIEILEQASGANFLQFHADACQHARLPQSSPHAHSLHGKAILYATHAGTFSSAAGECAQRLNADSAWPAVADIPHAGEPLPAGSPIVTVFAAGANRDEVIAQLASRCAELRALL